MTTTLNRLGGAISRGENPETYTTRLFTQFLQGLFNFSPPGQYHWEPDLEETELVITADIPLNVEVAGKRPSLAVVPGPSQDQGVGIDNLLHIDVSTGERIFTDMSTGFLVVYAVAETTTEARHLAHLVRHGVRTNRRLLESPGGFFQIGRPAMSINSPSPPGALVVGDPAGIVMVQLNIPYSFQWSWSTTPTAPPQNRTLDMITEPRRASDYDYAPIATLQRIELSISTQPVVVRRLGKAGRVTIHETGDPAEDFQTVIVVADENT